MGSCEQLRSFAFRKAPAAFLAIQLLGLPATPAQSMNGTDQTETGPYLEPLPEDGAEGQGPNVSFHLATEIGLPGPLLPGPGPRLVEGRLLTPVSAGMAACGWNEGAEVAMLPAPDPRIEGDSAEEPLWAVAPDGRIRVSVLESGHLLAQKRCKRCRAGWRKKWKLRLSGGVPAPPLVTDDRVFFGALDNRVYSLKRKNGHRVWEIDVQGRASRSLERWQGTLLDAEQPDALPWEGEPVDVVLVVPDHGGEILALDATSGAKIASYALAEDAGFLIGSPVLTPD